MASEGSFVHLHTHTEYSLLDGASRIADLVRAAKEDGQPALAITDHGNLYGAMEFYKACRKEGIKPIIGLEAYMVPTSRFERPARRSFGYDDTGGEDEAGRKLWYHVTLLATSTEGYRNLMKLSSYAFLEGYYYKPRADFELLERYHEGVVATSGCLGGLVAQALLADNYAQAREWAGRLQDIFGKENFFIEIQDHGMREQRLIIPPLVELSEDLGAPLVATNDSHYTAKSDAFAHDALLCVQTGKTLEDPNRLRFHGQEHYLKKAAEMRRLFADWPAACDATLEIAERAEIEIPLGGLALPRFPVPPEFQRSSYEESANAYLEHLTLEGAKKRYGDPVPSHVTERLANELSVIFSMGFSPYFLVIWDLIRYAKSKGIRVGPGRGSAAGCCVAYCLGIVELDPIRYDLLFERFLNPGRKQMPDIDIDFDERYRQEIINYVASRYGKDRVAQIITFSTIKARAAVRDAARILGLPYAVGDRIAKAMPPLVMGRDTPLAACFEKQEEYADQWAQAEELRRMYETDPDAKRVIDLARSLEGLTRQDGIHAAAVVITDEPLVEYLPIQRKPDPGQDPETAPVVTQYDMHAVEELGLLKMDFLGLRNLSVIDMTIELVRKSRGKEVDVDSIPLDDPATFEMLRRGESIGVFQLEGSAMRALMRQLAPERFDDVAALVGLYRPGPMAANMHKDYADRKNGRQEVTYLHPDMKDIVQDTYGLMIYQESVMRVAQRFAGYSLEEADNLRKACGKKIRSLIEAEREKFIAGCERQGYGADLGRKLFDIIEPFADYAFNKSHSYGYGLIAYQTAYLKANYPVEYMCALLTSVKDDKDHTALYLAECKRMGIRVRVPDVNTSESDFSPVVGEGGQMEILYGLSAIRNVGEGVVAKIIEERSRGGPFESFEDFIERVDQAVLGKRTVESLIKAGAFDSLGASRKALLLRYEAAIQDVTEARKRQEAGMVSLFEVPSNGKGGQAGAAGEEEEFDRKVILAFEKEVLGQYVSDHPLRGLEELARSVATHSTGELRELLDSEGAEGARVPSEVTLVGVVSSLSVKATRRGEPMATFVLEDLDGSIEVIVFPRLYSEARSALADDEVVRVTGRLDTGEAEPRLLAREVASLETEDGQGKVLKVVLPEHAEESELTLLAEIIKEHAGLARVEVVLGRFRYRLAPDWRVSTDSTVFAELKRRFGEGAVALV